MLRRHSTGDKPHHVRRSTKFSAGNRQYSRDQERWTKMNERENHEPVDQSPTERGPDRLRRIEAPPYAERDHGTAQNKQRRCGTPDVDPTVILLSGHLDGRDVRRAVNQKHHLFSRREPWHPDMTRAGPNEGVNVFVRLELGAVERRVGGSHLCEPPGHAFAGPP